MSLFKQFGLAGALMALAGVASAQATLFDTGVHQPCFFNAALTNLGWTSGNVSAAQPQRWTAQPFTLPAGNHHVVQIEAEYFVPAANPTAIAWVIWNRTGQNAPTSVDEVASGVVPFTAAGAPLGVDLTLPGGDYYLTIYAVAPQGTTIGWFTNAQNGIHFIEPSNSLPFMWRSSTYPGGGFLVYQLPAATLSQNAGLDPNKLYCAAFRIRGFTEIPSCVSGAGGALPDTTGGTWPTVLPTGTPFSSSIVLPSGMTSITSLKLNGLLHSWVGDVHLVLVDPNGVAHNLIQRAGFTGTGFGNSGDFVGNYEIVETGGSTFPPSGNVAVGVYNQYFGSGGGLWPSGNANVFNTPLSAIPVIPGGLYTLLCYDWAGGDTGNLGSWELCGMLDPTPTGYCTSGTSLAGCTPVMAYGGLPSVAASSGFLVGMLGADSNRNCGLLYSLSPAAIPLPGSSSLLCVGAPRQRLFNPLSTTGGTSGCDGQLVVDLSAFLAANPGALGAPFSAGDTLYLQGFNRDNGNGNRNLVTSNGMQITFIP